MVNAYKFVVYTFVGLTALMGYFACNQSCKKNKLETKIINLETRIHNDSMAYTMQINDKDKKVKICSDSLERTLISNKEIKTENKNLEQEKKEFENKYYSLKNQLEKFKEKGMKYDSLLAELQKVKREYANLQIKDRDLEDKFNELFAKSLGGQNSE